MGTVDQTDRPLTWDSAMTGRLIEVLTGSEIHPPRPRLREALSENQQCHFMCHDSTHAGAVSLGVIIAADTGFRTVVIPCPDDMGLWDIWLTDCELVTP